MRIAAPDEAPVSPARRELDRPQRFRWLGARRTSAECWDAYEHVEGQPFASLDVPYVPFQTVSRWLLALAQECRAAGADGTLPVIGVNRLWVTPRGEMKVADWPLPGANGDDESYATGDTRSCRAAPGRGCRSSMETRSRPRSDADLRSEAAERCG